MNLTPEAVFLAGRGVVMTPLGRADASPEYLAWLNDADVLRYRGPKAYPTTIAQLERWLDELPGRGDLTLAIRTQNERRHVGNIALNNILWVHRSAELSIMIGAKDIWGRGYGSEAIALVTAHAFSVMGLHRLWAESPNPAFNGTMRKLCWQQEGIKRDAFLLDGAFVDIECWGLLDGEWRERRGQTA
jgi:[ribosomal protein S5]-alanine N-acetyltransferase